MASFWQRVKEARIVRVTLAYLGASWVVLEFTGFLRDEFALPDWITPVAALLLLIGLIIIVATAWVQSSPAHQVAGEDVPSPWEVDVVDLSRSVSRGRLPRLTWARAILGGVVVFSLLFGAAGAYVLFTGKGPTVPTPSDAEAAVEPGVAVLPFRVVGPELGLWREGMVDLLSTNLDGAAGLRAIDPRGVLSRWSAEIGEGREAANRDAALAVAGGLGASYAVMGNAVDLGAGVRISAEVYQLEGGTLLGRTQVEGSADSVLALVDELSIQVLGAGLVQEGASLPSPDLSQVITHSLPALKAYLAGEQNYRRGRWEAAASDFSRAVEEDSTFALAWYRLGQAVGWIERAPSSRSYEYGQRAAEFSERLPERVELRLKGNALVDEGRREGVYVLEELTRKYPDDVEGWYALGEAYVHWGSHAFRSLEREEAALSKAVQLDPQFLAAYVHLIERAIADGDSARTARLVDAYRRHSATQRGGYELVIALAFGDSTAWAEAEAHLDTVSSDGIWEPLAWSLRFAPDRWERAAEVFSIFAASGGAARDRARGYNGLGWVYTLRGRLEEARETFAVQELEIPGSTSRAGALEIAALPPARFDYLLYRWGYGDPSSARRSLVASQADTTAGDRFFLGALAADRGRWAQVAAAIRKLESMAGAEEARNEIRAKLSALTMRSFAQSLRSYGELRRGDVAAAVEEHLKPLPRLTDEVQTFMLYELGLGLLQDGQLDAAERYLFNLQESAFAAPAEYHLGELHERRGDMEKAALHYSRFVRWWEDADPVLQSWVERGRAALQRVTREAV